MDTLTPFLTTISAVSIATERVVESVKGIMTTQKWPFKSEDEPLKERNRLLALHAFAGLCGSIIAALCKIDIWQKVGFFQIPNHDPGALYQYGSWAFTGLLASGGSSIWNHSLDILNATKIKQEQLAKSITATNRMETDTANGIPLGSPPSSGRPNPGAVLL